MLIDQLFSTFLCQLYSLGCRAWKIAVYEENFGGFPSSVVIQGPRSKQLTHFRSLHKVTSNYTQLYKITSNRLRFKVQETQFLVRLVNNITDRGQIKYDGTMDRFTN